MLAIELLKAGIFFQRIDRGRGCVLWRVVSLLDEFVADEDACEEEKGDSDSEADA